MAFKSTIVFFLILMISGCASPSAEEIECNFTSGSDFTEHSKESSWSDNFIIDIFVGLFNVTIQGAHRNISPDTYTSCSKPDKAICIDSEGNIKEECKLTN